MVLSRPEVLNVVNPQMHLEIEAGRAFSSGGDLKWMQERIKEPSKGGTALWCSETYPKLA